MFARLIRSALFVLALLGGVAGAAPLAIVTIADGELLLIRDDQRHAAAEGVRLRSDDILATGAATRLVRIEFTDGSALDLGPDTQVLLATRTGVTAYVKQGWAKLGAAKGSAASIGSPQLELASIEGTALLRVGKELTTAFVESGRAEGKDRRAGQSAQAQALAAGQSLALRGAESATVLARPPAELLKDMPRGFMDSLPLRARIFQAKVTEPGTGADARYADVAPWLNAEAMLRQGFVARFRPLASDRQFRAGLVADLRSHPEWDRVLFPEKYRPKPRPVAAASAPAAVAEPAAAAVAAPVDSAPLAASLPADPRWPAVAGPAR